MSHAELSRERWAVFTLPEQLLQIAAEMHRARSSFESADERYRSDCYERALQLVDRTIDVQHHTHLLRELRLWRDYVASLRVGAADPRGHVNALRALLRLHPATNEQVELLGLDG